MIALLAMALLLADPPTDGSASAISASGLPRNALPAQAGDPIPRDTLTRVPGSVLRLGWSPERAQVLGAFRMTQSGPASVTREGQIRWFASPAKAALTYREGRLAGLRIEANNVSPRFGTYVTDELRRQGYLRTGEEVISRGSITSWQGRSRIRLTISPANVTAEISPRPDEQAGSAPHGVTTAAAARGTAADVRMATATAAVPTREAGRLDFTAAGDSLTPPVRSFSPSGPARPRIAMDAGVFGRVTVRAQVDSGGNVTRTVIERGIAELNDAALNWASAVRFAPYVRDGRPLPFEILIAVAFLPAPPPATGRKP